MKSKNFLWTLFLCGLMAMALALVATGCDDDDDSDDLPVPGDPVPDDGDPAPDDAAPDPVADDVVDDDIDSILTPVLVAPTLWSPPDRTDHQVPVRGTKNINFQWSSVPGAKSYELHYIAGTICFPDAERTIPVAGTSITLTLDPANYEWKVRAVIRDTKGPYSATRLLVIFDGYCN